MIEDFALTLRKKNGMLWLAAQQPEHITESAVGASLASQAQTVFAFPSRDADPAQFIDQLGFTRPMYRALTEEMPTLSYRSVMMKRDSGSAILRVELTDMADEIAILSGREETARLIPAIRALVGNDPDAFTTEFLRRVHAIRKGAE
jgi:type IV secretion system protein VirB4